MRLLSHGKPIADIETQGACVIAGIIIGNIQQKSFFKVFVKRDEVMFVTFKLKRL